MILPIFDHEGRDRIAEFVVSRMEHEVLISHPFTTFGAMDERGEIIGGVIYSGYAKLHEGSEIEMTLAGTPGRLWLTKTLLAMAFDYPFNQLGCTRVYAGVHQDNAAAIKLDTKLGFKQEGRLRNRYCKGQDILIFGMLKEECRWLRDRPALNNSNNKKDI